MPMEFKCQVVKLANGYLVESQKSSEYVADVQGVVAKVTQVLTTKSAPIKKKP